MAPYILVILIPFIFQILFSRIRLEFGGLKTANNRSHGNVNKEILLPVFFVCLLFLLAMRDETLGRDLNNYLTIFKKWGRASFVDVFSDFGENLFHFYCWFFYNFISENYQLFVSATSVVTIIPMAYVYNRDKSFGYLKMIIFITSSIFIMLFSGIRQCMAISVGLLAYEALKNKKYVLHYVLVITALLFHHTGFMLFLILPIYKIKIKKKDLIWFVPASVLIIIFSSEILSFLSELLTSYNEKYNASISATGAVATFFLFLLFSVFCLIIADDDKMDEEALGLRNFLLLATLLQFFAYWNNLVMRMNYYFIIFIPIAIGKCMKYVKKKYRDLARIGYVVICIFLTIYYLYTTYISFKTGVSALDTIPYVPFWEG